MDQQDLYWLAGLLEGEGSFLLGPPCRPDKPSITLSLTDQDIITRAAKLMGVRYVRTRVRPNKLGSGELKPAYVITLYGQRALRLMSCLYPLLSKRRQAQISRVLRPYGLAFNQVTATDVFEDNESEPDSEMLIIRWLAGVLEGEGSFMSGAPSRPNSPRIQVTMTDEDVIVRIANILGVRYNALHRSTDGEKAWKQAYFICWRGKRALEWMRKLYPLMGARRQAQIDQALASHDPFKHYKNNAKLSEEQVREIYLRAHAGELQSRIAGDFGVDRTTVADIKRGKSWAWLKIANNTIKGEET